MSFSLVVLGFWCVNHFCCSHYGPWVHCLVHCCARDFDLPGLCHPTHCRWRLYKCIPFPFNGFAHFLSLPTYICAGHLSSLISTYAYTWLLDQLIHLRAFMIHQLAYAHNYISSALSWMSPHALWIHIYIYIYMLLMWAYLYKLLTRALPVQTWIPNLRSISLCTRCSSILHQFTKHCSSMFHQLAHTMLACPYTFVLIPPLRQ